MVTLTKSYSEQIKTDKIETPLYGKKDAKVTLVEEIDKLNETAVLLCLSTMLNSVIF